MSRQAFTDLFRRHIDGSFEPLKRIKIGDAEIGPGVRLRRGVLIFGIDLSLFSDKDFEIDDEGGVAVVRSIYQ